MVDGGAPRAALSPSTALSCSTALSSSAAPFSFWRRPPQYRRAAGLVIALTLTGACATRFPSTEALLPAPEYISAEVQGKRYRHRVFRAGAAMSPGVLHVYIEHDGQPWKMRGQVPAPDPTPLQPVMAQLMRLDTAPRVLLGRPCHHGLAASQHCDALVWTHARYSDAVVESMAAALRAQIALSGAHAVRLFGHSGGGTLAVLLAYRVPQVRAVVTLAGNLSVSQWAALHGYSPLAGSLDPATLPPLPGAIHQMHFVGAQDHNTTPALLQAYARGHPHATVRVLEEVDHLCCWARHWPVILAGLPPAGQ